MRNILMWWIIFDLAFSSLGVIVAGIASIWVDGIRPFFLGCGYALSMGLLATVAWDWHHRKEVAGGLAQEFEKTDQKSET